MEQPPVLLVNAPQAAAMLSISRTKLYELIARKEIPVIKIDRSTRLSVKALREWVATHTDKEQEI